MMHSGIRRTGRRVALLALYPLRDPSMPQFISNHGMRMIEASLRASELEGLELQVYDLFERIMSELVEDLLAFDPDVIGFSAYLWSFPFFLEVAKHLKESDPARLVVFGGPSARPSMMNLDQYLPAKKYVDVLVINEGEETFAEIVKRKDRSPESLCKINGIALPDGESWFQTQKRIQGDLNTLASPYQMGLVPNGGLSVLQTYRGCPFTCSFCEWGTLESPKRVRDVDSLCIEFNAMEKNQVNGALLVDAGLNLNSHAFENLCKAVETSGFLEGRQLICEVYPAKDQKKHIDFLSSVGMPLVGVGLQSFDNDVLAHIERSYDEDQFEETLEQLTNVAGVALEIIMGLPGDNPESFRQNFIRARTFPCALRVYHCVVLPSALMVRAPANFELDYDPISLKMRSCLGWSEKDLETEQEFLTQQASVEGGQSGEFFWIFPPPKQLENSAYPISA